MNISVDTTMKKIALNMTVATNTGSGKHQSEMFVLQDYVMVSLKGSLLNDIPEKHRAYKI